MKTLSEIEEIMQSKELEEKRIYVIVAETIFTTNGKIIQPPGRQVAQACHAVGLFRYQQARDRRPYDPITTIVLQVRDTAELNHVYDLLLCKKIKRFLFRDTNPEYGVREFSTAFCTEPVYKEQVEGILDYLPLWGAKWNLQMI